MLTHDEFTMMERELREVPVLSIYVDGWAADPAAKRGWRVAVDQELRSLRSRLATRGEAERASFEKCVRMLTERLAGMTGAIGAPGFAAFVTEMGVQHASRLPVRVSTQAAWGNGMRVAPYVRVLKHLKPVVVVLVDASEAKVFRYLSGRLEALKPVAAHARKEPVYHMGHPPEPHFHHGARGATGHDEAHDATAVGTQRMLSEMSTRALRFAHHDGYLLVGGVPRIRGEACAVLEREARGRVIEIDLDVHATEAEILEATAAGASAIRNKSDVERMRELVEQSGPGAQVVTGMSAVEPALRAAAVHQLFLTPRRLAEAGEEAESAIRMALAQGAQIETFADEAAEALDERGGIAARLRYAVPPM